MIRQDPIATHHSAIKRECVHIHLSLLLPNNIINVPIMVIIGYTDTQSTTEIRVWGR
jgi:hypothetical protein